MFSIPDEGLKLAMKTINVKRKDSRELAILKIIDHTNIVKLRCMGQRSIQENSRLADNVCYDRGEGVKTNKRFLPFFSHDKKLLSDFAKSYNVNLFFFFYKNSLKRHSYQ